MSVRIDAMTAEDWPSIRAIYLEGIATGDATLERDAPDWARFDHAHRPECRYVALDGRPGDTPRSVLGWTAISPYSSRQAYAGVAWESVYVAASARGRGVGRALLEALIPASETAGFWTLLAGIMAENAASLALHERVGFERVGVQRRVGQDVHGRWRDVVLMERRSGLTGI